MHGKQIARRKLLRGFAGGASVIASANVLVRRARAAEYVLKYGNNTPVTGPLTIEATAAAGRIKEETGGRLDIQVFPNNQLGGDLSMLSQIRYGSLEMMHIAGQVLGTLVPLSSLQGVAFAFNDYDQAWAAMDGELGNLVHRAIEKAGLVALRFVWDSGFREVSSSTHPINTPEGFKDFKIRVPAGPMWVSLFSALGASPVFIDATQLYTGLKTRLADGAETSLTVMDLFKFYEVQRYISLTNHQWECHWVLVNAAAWQKLPPDLQEIVIRNFAKGGQAERIASRKLNETLRSQMEARGLIFNTTDPARFREKLVAAGYYRDWQAKFGAENWAILQKYAPGLSSS
jgi:tripartite ATP-independent transporter DctP family solute receptor